MIAAGECHVTKGIDIDMLWICHIILFLFSLQSAGAATKENLFHYDYCTSWLLQVAQQWK